MLNILEIQFLISDKLLPHDDDSGTVDYYLADILQSTDYSPFGVTLHGRNFQLLDPVNGNPVDKMRFEFNNMELDDEVKGEGNSYDFGARMLDPRIGRWLTIDRRFKEYSCFSPYIYGYFFEVTIIPNTYYIRKQANKNNVEFDEVLLGVMTVETGHFQTIDQPQKEAEMQAAGAGRILSGKELVELQQKTKANYEPLLIKLP